MAPDNQPDGWGDVFAGSAALLDGWVQLAPDLTGCQGVSYQQTAREGNESGIDYVVVSFTFDMPCGTHARDGSAISPSEVEPVGGVAVVVENSTGRWYVYLAEAVE